MSPKEKLQSLFSAIRWWDLSSLKRKTPAIKKTSFIFWQLKTKLVQLECYKETFFLNAMILSSCEWERVQSCMKHKTPTTPGPVLESQTSVPQFSWGLGQWFLKLFCSVPFSLVQNEILPSSGTSTSKAKLCGAQSGSGRASWLAGHVEWLITEIYTLFIPRELGYISDSVALKA